MSKNIARREADAAQPVTASPAQSETAAIIQMIERAARDPNVDIDKMERLFAMRERMEAREAEAAFNAAMAACQKACKPVARNAYNPHTKSRYAALDALANSIDPVVHDNGFGCSYGEFEAKKPDHLGVLVDVTHSSGHSKQYRFEIPFDGVGAKGNVNKTQTHAYGSTLTYGRRYAKLMVFDIATTDDDGNAAGGVEPREKITEEQAAQLKKLMAAANVEEQIIFEHFRVAKLDELTPDQFRTAMNKCKKKIELMS